MGSQAWEWSRLATKCSAPLEPALSGVEGRDTKLAHPGGGAAKPRAGKLFVSVPFSRNKSVNRLFTH